MALLERRGGVAPPPPARMPLPGLRLRLAMRDGIRLDTSVWLPETPGPAPAILLRTPYKESVMGFKRLGVLRYVEAGYAVVIQMIRGIGQSEGRFLFSSPQERTDGYDTIEWIAAQAWCDGGVGMDGSSYVAMTQLAAASTRPPHLRCIVPAVPTVDFFREIPYAGGIFSRLHTINWTHLLQIESLAEQVGGFVGTMPILSQPEYLERMTRRPLIDAADGELEGEFLQHYRDALAHPTRDDWWRARELSAEDFGRIDLPTLVVSGNFDLCIGALTLWRGLEANAAHPEARQLLIGPWDHGQSYSGGVTTNGPYDLPEDPVIDLPGLRLAFFDRHLRKRGLGAELGARVRVFITGANAWRTFDAFPPREVAPQRWYLRSGGQANSARGDGRLATAAAPGAEPVDWFVDDPAVPFVPALASAREASLPFDLREREQHHETLVYDTGPLDAPVTILGEAEAQLFVAVDAPDADVVVWVAEHRADGRTVRLASGRLRLRYHAGFDRERLLTPGVAVEARIPLTYVGHRVPAGSRLRLLIAGSEFPWGDPNPHTGEPVATAVGERAAVQSLRHDAEHPSCLMLPVLT